MNAQLERNTAFGFLRLQYAVKVLLAAALSLYLLAFAGFTQFHRPLDPRTEIGFIAIGHDIKLRRMVVHSSKPKGVVLLLHGFPETLIAWKDIASALGNDFEVHAFDWPGYGLSSRPPVDRFSYAPRDYAYVLKQYIVKSGLDTSKLVIYSTDIGALPALLLALDEPTIARTIVVGDFAPFDRPQYMYPSLQSLKSQTSAEATHAYMNRTRDEILENAFRRGLPESKQFEVSQELKDDMSRGWNQDGMTSADAFYHYYSHFTRDQNHFESNLDRLKTPVRVIWGERDIYIKADMGLEFAKRTNTELRVLPGLGHYPHLQSPRQTIDEIRALFGS
jgi:pimeloyl-ACP methyl ester carboxylesterase